MTWGVKRYSVCGEYTDNKNLEPLCRVYTKQYKKKYGVSGFSCICRHWRHMSCDADDGSNNSDPTAALWR
jgi:hypothetical protein